MPDDPFSPEALSEEFTGLYSTRLDFTPKRQSRIEDFYQGQAKKVAFLSTQIADRSYKPKYKGVLIDQPKSDGSIKKRGITPLGCADWIIQRRMLELLSEAVGPCFATKPSYGRKKVSGESSRSPANCCKAIADARKNSPVAFRADLIDFFPSVCRTTLLDALRARLPSDWPWLWLLETLIVTDAEAPKEAAFELKAKFWPRGVGVHQGTILAPLFANVVMADWDRNWEGKVQLFRYVDDWLVLAESLAEVETLSKEMVASLPAGVKCHLHDSRKCETFKGSETVQFLGLAITSDQRIGPGKAAVESHSRSLRERSSKAKNVIDLGQSLLRFNAAWTDYYAQAGMSQSMKGEAKGRTSDAIDRWLENSKVPKPNRPLVRNLLLEYRPKPDSKLKKSIDAGLESGEIAPGDVTYLLGKHA